MDAPNDIAEHAWEKAQTVTDKFEGDEGTTYDEYWRRVEIIARLIVAERRDGAEEALARAARTSPPNDARIRERALDVVATIRPREGVRGIVEINAGWLTEAADTIQTLLAPPPPSQPHSPT